MPKRSCSELLGRSGLPIWKAWVVKSLFQRRTTRADAHSDPLRQCGLNPIDFWVNSYRTRNGTTSQFHWVNVTDRWARDPERRSSKCRVGVVVAHSYLLRADILPANLPS